MQKPLYRFEGHAEIFCPARVIQGQERGGYSVSFVIHPDIFFNTKDEAIQWGIQCQYFLEKNKKAEVKLVVRDSSGKAAARIAKNNLFEYDYKINDIGNVNKPDKRRLFEEMFELASTKSSDFVIKLNNLNSTYQVGIRDEMTRCFILHVDS